MTTVKIYKPYATPTQSGPAKTDGWRLEYMQEDDRFIEPIMGWTATRTTSQQVKLKFDSKEEAVEYAKENNLAYEIMEPNIVAPKKPKSYAENFTD